MTIYDSNGQPYEADLIDGHKYRLLERELNRLRQLESDMASITDLLNTWAREAGVDEAHSWFGRDIKAVIDRLWAHTNRNK